MREEVFAGKIVLEDGQEFYGRYFGQRAEKVLEIVFNTSMTGYQEILSDPSYTGQAVVMTYPLIGNYGMNEEDYETRVSVPVSAANRARGAGKCWIRSRPDMSAM